MRRSLGHLVLASLALLMTGCGLFGPKAPPFIDPGSSVPAPAPSSGNLSLPPVALPSGITSATPTSPPAASTTTTTTAPAGDVRTVAEAGAFATPSGRIVCLVTIDSIRCDFVGTDKSWKAPKPTNCELDWGSSLYVTKTAGSTCAGDTVIDTASVDSDYVSWRKPTDPIVTVYDLKLVALPYGSSVAAVTFRCDSASTGVTCQNTATGHGFTMSREAYSVF
jgi:hypothetical protein